MSASNISSIPSGHELDAWIAKNICGRVLPGSGPYPKYTQDLNAIQEVITAWCGDDERRILAFIFALPTIQVHALGALNPERQWDGAYREITAAAEHRAQALYMAWIWDEHERNKEDPDHD